MSTKLWYKPLSQFSMTVGRHRLAATLRSEVAKVLELDETVRDDIESNKIKPRKHPGVMKIGSCTLPENIVEAIKIVCEDHPVKPILQDAKALTNYLFSRHYPWEEDDLRERQRNFEEDVTEKLGALSSDATEEQVHHYRSLVNASVSQLMRKYNYHWSPLDLQQYSCLVYLFTRAAPNYAVAIRVFNEIFKLRPDYRPTTLFDFGSGLGTVSWAAKHYWGKSLKEFMNIDSSDSMNALAQLLLCGGKEQSDTPQGVFYRMFLPAQHRPYSIVVSAHSLMEMPSRDSRLKLLLNLWNKTEDFLVIIEQGTKPGFKIVVEARDFILSLNDKNPHAHILSPCPHDGPCPRLLRGPYPCHFQVGYSDLAVGKKEVTKKELVSYVIISKGEVKEAEHRWPRVVRPILKRHHHTICRLCTPYGDLREVIFTPNKHGKVLYKCARTTNWGDRLPISLPPSPEENSNTSQENCQPDNIDHQPNPD